MIYHLVQDCEQERQAVVEQSGLSDVQIVLSTCEAADWIEAKSILAGQLTDLQEEMLALDAAGRERVLSRERWFGAAGALTGRKPKSGDTYPMSHIVKGWAFGH